MKTIRVVAAVIKAVKEDGRTMILQHSADMVSSKADGNSRAARSKPVRHRKKR